MAATNALAHLALFGANAILGAGSVVSKLGLAGCNPVMFALLREMLAAPLLFLLSLCATGSGSAGSRSRDSDQIGCDRRGFDRIDALQFFVAGLMLFGTNLGYIIGVKLLGATTAAIWQSALPIFTMLIAVLVGYERLTMLKALGVLAAFTGCAFVSLYRPMNNNGGASDDFDGSRGGAGSATSHVESSAVLTGNLIFLVQVIACAAFFVAEKPLLRRWTPLATLAYSYAVASLLMLLAALIINATPELLDLVCPDCHGQGWAVPVESAFAIAYWVLFGSVTAYFLATWGNQHVDASVVGVYFTVQPLASVAAAMLVIALTAPPHRGMVGPGLEDLGAVGILVGVVLLTYDARRVGKTSDPVAHEQQEEEAAAARINGRAGPGSMAFGSAAEPGFSLPAYVRLEGEASVGQVDARSSSERQPGHGVPADVI